MLDLDSLLAPVPLTDFLDNYWGKSAIYIPGDESKTKGLFDWNEFNQTINYGTTDYPKIKVIIDEDPHAIDDDYRDLIPQWVKEGATLLLNSVNKFDPVMNRLATNISRDMNTPVNINCYVSWPNRKGFNIHFDFHDVFIVHTTGRKSWKVYHPTYSAPLQRQKLSQQTRDLVEGAPYLECELSPGDVLYIPRGHSHLVESVTPCIHLTLGSRPISGVSFIQWLVEDLMKEQEFLRKDFPVIDVRMLGGKRNDDELISQLESFSGAMKQIMDKNYLAKRLKDYCMMSNALPDKYQLPQDIQSDTVTQDTLFRFTYGNKFLISYHESKKQASILARGQQFTLHDVSHNFLAGLFDGRETVSTQSLLANCPEMTDEQVGSILINLHEMNILEIDQ